MSVTDKTDETVVRPAGSPERQTQERKLPRIGEQPLLDLATSETIDLVQIGEVEWKPRPVKAPAPSNKPETAAGKPSRRELTPKAAERILLAVCVAIPLLQAPGLVFTDSRSELTSNPSLFLHRVWDVWSSSYDLGHVQSGQFVGYIIPMAPFFAGVHALGIPMWLTERIWVSLILIVGSIGVSRLVAALWDRSDGMARLIAGLIFALNPYVVTQFNRGTISLLAYCIAPWLLLCAHQGLLQPRRWLWPITAGILVALGGGGVNAAVLMWVMIAPLLLVAYEVAVIGRSRRAAWSLLWRTGICTLGLSLWWLIPVTLQSKYGADFLSFTEQPSTIWATNSVSESLRLLGYWITYFQIGFGSARPVVPPTVVYLFAPLLVMGSFAVPLLAFGALPKIWRRPYVPYFVLLAVGATIAMAVGFPPGKPLYNLLIGAYYKFPLLQVLRTTYKAAPLLAMALACLAGAGGATLIRSSRTKASRRGVALGMLAIPIVFGWPLITGTALDPALTYKGIPSYWREASDALSHDTRPGYRALILPGQQFGVYRWGTTFDPIAPALTSAPVAQRYSVRYSDAHSSQLLTDVDNLVQQRRLVPGQLGGLMRLLGVQQVLVAADGKPENSGEIDPASALSALRMERQLRKPTATYGPKILVSAAVGRGGDQQVLPAIRRYALGANDPSAPGLVRAHSLAGSVMVSGDASALTEMAADGLLPRSRAVLLSGDQTRSGIRQLIHSGASVVITDTNRRQTVLATRTTHDQGSVLSGRDAIQPDVPSYDIFSGKSNSKQTIAVYTDLAYVTNPEGPQLLLRPEARPYAALDGNLKTSWTPANFLPQNRWIEFGLKRPLKVAAIRIHPHRDALVQTTLAAVSINGAPEVKVPLVAGWNTVRIGSAPLTKLRVRILHTSTFGGIDLGGIDEIQVPGLHPKEWLRTPVWMPEALAGTDLSRTPISVLLARQTTSDPYRQSGAFGGPVPTGDPQATFDAETGIRRLVSIPVARSFVPSGWASSAPWAPDASFDRLVGGTGGWTFAGSPRFEGVPNHRASSAFDANPRTAWVAESRPGVPAWISWRSPAPVTMRRLKLVPDSTAYKRATKVKISFGGLSTAALPVASDGTVVLPQAVTSKRVRIDIVSSATPHGPASFRLLPAVAIREIQIPGVRTPHVRRSGSFSTGCGAMSIESGDSTVKTLVAGSVSDLDNARPLRFRVCGANRKLDLAGGPDTIEARPGPMMRIDHLRLSSPAPKPALLPTAASAASPATGADGFAEVHFGARGWLVRGESFSLGWKATCGPDRAHQRNLGAPVVVDGFANGWQVGPWCRFAKFDFSPQQSASSAYIASAGATGLFALVLMSSLWAARRRRLAGEPDPIIPMPNSAPGDDRLAHATQKTAAVIPLIAGAIAAALFALRVAPPVALIALFLGLWGVNVRRLYIFAFAALSLVPLAYIGLLPANHNGGNFYYAVELIGAHWMATLAILLAGAGATLTALRIRWSTHPRAGNWSLRRVQSELRRRRFRTRGASESRSSRKATHAQSESD